MSGERRTMQTAVRSKKILSRSPRGDASGKFTDLKEKRENNKALRIYMVQGFNLRL